MKVYVLVEVIYDSPETPNASVFASKADAEVRQVALIAENSDSDQYICELIETIVQ